jgi:hypothetical protein
MRVQDVLLLGVHADGAQGAPYDAMLLATCYTAVILCYLLRVQQTAESNVPPTGIQNGMSFLSNPLFTTRRLAQGMPLLLFYLPNFHGPLKE